MSKLRCVSNGFTNEVLNSYSYKWQITGKEMKNGTDSQYIE